MQLLNTLADQTAIALENARLVSDLIRLNRDLKQAFADLEKAHHQLNELDRLKSAFIGAITHELRTPVANIQFSIQLIEKYGVENFGPEQQEQFHQLIDAARQTKTMVDNLVNFATFLGKQGDLKLTDFGFSEVLAETVVMLEPHARRKDITLRLDVADEGLPNVHGDQARLSDAAYHLIQNAIKFTGPNGMVTARCRSKDGQLIFEVVDTGVGVPPDKLDSLWEGFSQMADPLKRGLEGLGLGLALVKYVVTAHDGETFATSTGVAGEGSTFGFRIPLAGPKPRALISEAELALNPGQPEPAPETAPPPASPEPESA
jgi:signal transduction histidine kinase